MPATVDAGSDGRFDESVEIPIDAIPGTHILSFQSIDGRETHKQFIVLEGSA
jgi:hypothetical protein